MENALMILQMVVELSLYIGTNVPYYIINLVFLKESELVTGTLLLRTYICIRRATLYSEALKNIGTDYLVQHIEMFVLYKKPKCIATI